MSRKLLLLTLIITLLFFFPLARADGVVYVKVQVTTHTTGAPPLVYGANVTVRDSSGRLWWYGTSDNNGYTPALPLAIGEQYTFKAVYFYENTQHTHVMRQLDNGTTIQLDLEQANSMRFVLPPISDLILPITLSIIFAVIVIAIVLATRKKARRSDRSDFFDEWTP